MVFLMVADGSREPLAPSPGVQRSFNKSQSVLCHYINIFGQLLWRSGGAASHQSLWYVGTGETSGAANLQKLKRKDSYRQKHSYTPVYLQASKNKNYVPFLIPHIHRTCVAVTSLSVNKKGRRMDTHNETHNLFPAVKMKSRNTKTIHGCDYVLLLHGCKNLSLPAHMP